MDFEKIADCLSDIACTGSTLEKTMLLRKYAGIEGFKEILQFIYSPDFTTGLKQTALNKAQVISNQGSIKAETIMQFLKDNCTGGSYAIDIAAAFVYQFDEGSNAEWAAIGLVTKDLQLGINVTTLNKVYGSLFIPKIGIMRGMLCPAKISGNYIVTEKIDGNRRLIFTKPTGIEIYTRSGKRDMGLIEIEKEAEQLPIGYVFDCELAAVGDYEDNIALRQATASIANSKGSRRGVKALSFDVIPLSEYEVGKSMYSAVARKTILAKILGDAASVDFMFDWATRYDIRNGTVMRSSLSVITNGYTSVLLPHIMALPILGIISSKEEAMKMAEPIWETGGEGLMLVEWKSPYEVCPNPRKTLLKIKATKEFTCKCIDVAEGDNKYTGMLGSIIIEYIKNGKIYLVKVGSGFPDYLRDEYWQHPEQIIGKKVEIECFGESRNAGGGYSLNCPIFKRIAGEKE